MDADSSPDFSSWLARNSVDIEDLSPLVDALMKRCSFTPQEREAFHTWWTTAAAHTRRKIGDDRIVASLLRHVLPRYDGPSMTLYRGENLADWRAGRVGFCWTVQRETAEMFASGLNSVPDGGIVLRVHCSPKAILAGPSAHSHYLGEAEYTVDPFDLTDIKELKRFSP